MRKKQIAALLVAVILVVGMIFAYSTFSEKTTEGTKVITIEVKSKDETSTLYEVKTDAEYLLGAMEDADNLSFSGSEGQYGFTVTTINGETADFTADSSYWAFSVNDGDAFSIIYSIY